MTRLDPSTLNKNGCVLVGDCYCWNCSGSNYKYLCKLYGKGIMKFTGKVSTYDGEIVYHYECVKCSYGANYRIGYQNDYGIK